MAFKLPPAQMALSPGDLVEGGVIKVTASPGLASIDARAEDLGAKVWLQVQQIIAMVRPDTLHCTSSPTEDPMLQMRVHVDCSPIVTTTTPHCVGPLQ